MIDVNRKGEVWVFAEQEDGSLHDVVLELCGKARELADRLGVAVGVVLPGANVSGLAERLIAQGADRVYLAEDAAAVALSNPALCPGAVRADRGAPAADRDLRGDGDGARPGPAGGLDDAGRHDRRLHGPGDQRRHRPADQDAAREPAAPDSAGVRRQHHRHDRQLRPVAADGHGPRRA